jgi:hypothetical protein
MSKCVAPHSGNFTQVLLPVTQRTEALAKAKPLPTIRRTFIKATVAAYRVNPNHGFIVPAYQRPSFIW